MRIIDLFSGAGGLTFGFYYKKINNEFLKINHEFVFANEFDKEFNGKNIFDELVGYFYNLNLFIESNIDNNVDSALIISFANRIIEVGNDIIKINGYLNKLITTDVELIMDKIINVKNTYISGILNG